MRALLFAVALTGCAPSKFHRATYFPSVHPIEPWCRTGTGSYALAPQPSVAPDLVDCPFRYTEKDEPPTLAELVIEPGAAIEIPVRIPAVLQNSGCRIDSIVIAHGVASSDLAIAIGDTPIVAYDQLPPEAIDDARIVRDPRTAVTGDPELWPIGAKIRFDGRSAEDGTAMVTLVEPPLPGGPAAPMIGPPPEPPPPPPQVAAVDVSAAPGAIDVQVTEPAKPPASPALELAAYRHAIGVPATDAFTIVLRARSRAFGIGVRSDRESKGATLGYRRANDQTATQTHLVAQVGVQLARCGRPLGDVLHDIH